MYNTLTFGEIKRYWLFLSPLRFLQSWSCSCTSRQWWWNPSSRTVHSEGRGPRGYGDGTPCPRYSSIVVPRTGGHRTSHTSGSWATKSYNRNNKNKRFSSQSTTYTSTIQAVIERPAPHAAGELAGPWQKQNSNNNSIDECLHIAGSWGL